MTKNADKLFEPKKVTQNVDWLASNQLPGQTYSEYRTNSLGTVRWIDRASQKIYLTVVNTTMSDAEVESYRAYAEAFFTGISVEILKMPKLVHHECVETRAVPGAGHQYKTEGMDGILAKVAKYRPRDAYAMLVITNLDLYDTDKRQFCFGSIKFDQ